LIGKFPSSSKEKHPEGVHFDVTTPTEPPSKVPKIEPKTNVTEFRESSPSRKEDSSKNSSPDSKNL